MGIAIYLELERVTSEMVLAQTEGKDLSRASVVDERQVLAPLWKFASITAAQLADLEETKDEFEEMAGQPFPTVEWFDAAPALEALRQVKRDLDARPDAFGAHAQLFEGVMEDLTGIEQELGQAVKFGVRVHLVSEF